MRKKTYLKLVDYQTEQSEKHLNEVRSIHKEMRGYKHDFHHHLQTLKGQLEAGEIERALAYIEQLDTQLMQVDTLLKTGNVSLDAILSAKIAQAKAEERRVMAIALEQEMRAAVVAAEAEVPKAMAEALRSGNMGVMDYYRLQNVQADTGMKTKIGSGIEHYTAQKKGTTND